MLMIRFQRIGRKNDPAFRIVVLEKQRSPKAGRPLAQLGTYNPKTKAFNADGAVIQDWVKKGAQISPSLNNLLISKGVIEGKKVNVLPKKSPIKKEQEAVAVAAKPKAAEAVADAAPEVVVAAEAPEATEAAPAEVEAEAAEVPAEVAA